MPAFLFLGTLLAVQLMEGTDPAFAALMLLAQIFAIMAFNTLGGFSHVAGSICLFSLLPNVTVPEIAHAAVLQPGDFSLLASLQLAGICAVFYASFYAAARFVVQLPTPRPFLDRVKFTMIELRAISLIAVICSVSIFAASLAGGEVQSGSALAAVNHFYPILNPLSVVLATYVRLQSTQGRSAMNWYIALLLAITTLPGILSASKEGMLSPVFCWLVVCAIQGYRFSKAQVVALAGVALVTWFFVYPYSQNARDPVREAGSVSDKLAVAEAYFRDPTAFSDEAENTDTDIAEYGESSPNLSIIQRFSLLGSGGMLVHADQVEGFTGIERYLPALVFFIPHFIWPDRPNPILSNELGHKAGFNLARRDTTTGIAISSPALFYDIAGWLGLPVYATLEFGLFFYGLRCLVGDARTESVWGLMLIGGTALLAGGISPSGPIDYLESFVAVFSVLVVTLKVLAYVSEALFARPISQ
ncbi:MAG: hypothetical protein WBQ94_09600 [Terracidiphilus sp.]